MSFFKCRKHEIEAQRWILKVVNKHCPEMAEAQEGPRLEGRVNLTIPVWLVPVEGRMPQVGRAFAAVTKEFSPSGLAIVVNRPFAAETVWVGFQWQDEKRFLTATVRHVNAMGAGFSQVGVRVTEVVCNADYPELEALNF